MSDHAVRRGASTRIPTAATPHPRTPDHDAWHQFLHDPQTLTWIDRIIRGQLGYRPRPDRLDHLRNTAWLKLAEATQFRLGHSGVQPFAIELIRRALMDDRRREYRWCKNTVSTEEAARDPSLRLDWDADHAARRRCERAATTTDVHEAVGRVGSDERCWAETFLAETANAPPDPLRSTTAKLGWTRHRSERARSALSAALADLRPKPVKHRAMTRRSKQRDTALACTDTQELVCAAPTTVTVQEVA